MYIRTHQNFWSGDPPSDVGVMMVRSIFIYFVFHAKMYRSRILRVVLIDINIFLKRDIKELLNTV